MKKVCESMSESIEKHGKLAVALRMLELISDYFKHNFDYKDSSPKQSMTREIDELIEFCKKE
jgi:hypothetical protein